MDASTPSYNMQVGDIRKPSLKSADGKGERKRFVMLTKVAAFAGNACETCNCVSVR